MLKRIATIFLFLISCNHFAQDSNQVVSNDTIAITIPEPSEKVVSAPVILDSDTIFFLKNDINSYPVDVRAKEISSRLEKLTKNYNVAKDSLYLRKTDDFYEVMYNDDLAFVTTENDAKHNDAPLLGLATIRLNSLQNSLDSIEVLTPKEWLIRIGYFALSLIVLIGIFKLINILFRRLNIHLSKIEKNFLRKNKNIIKYFIPKDTVNIFVFLSSIVRIGLIVLILFVYAPFMFSFFPWAERVVDLFYGYISTPIKHVAFGFIDFIPNLFFIIVIVYLARYVVRVSNDIALDVEKGKFTLINFHKDWARPTSKIINIFIYAIALVMVFPYLPGSESSAFQGVSIFIGAIISFGSTSAIANIIAGIVITYMRPFQIGDRVKIGSVVGDVIDKTTLVTHIRTPKNEDVTIPNANILTGNIVNYSNNESQNVILHTTITLGYDLPWQTAEELLIKSAKKTIHIDKDPQPFVLHTSLDDYYVSYELNAYTSVAKKIPFIYSEMHKNILDVFNEAGVEILSPAYTAARDGSLTTVPSLIRPNEKSPLNKLVDHLTGRNQGISIKKQDDTKEKKQ